MYTKMIFFEILLKRSDIGTSCDHAAKNRPLFAKALRSTCIWHLNMFETVFEKFETQLNHYTP